MCSLLMLGKNWVTTCKTPELQRLAAAIQTTVKQVASRKYLTAFCHWKNWAKSHGFLTFPVKVPLGSSSSS